MAKEKTKNPYLAFRFDIQDSVLCPVPSLGPTDFPSLARSILLISTDARSCCGISRHKTCFGYTLLFLFFYIALLRDPVHPVTFPKAVGFISRIHLAPSKANSRGRKWRGGPVRSSAALWLISGRFLSKVERLSSTFSSVARGNVGRGETFFCFVFKADTLKGYFLFFRRGKKKVPLPALMSFVRISRSLLLLFPSLPNCREQQLLPAWPPLTLPDSCVGKGWKLLHGRARRRRHRPRSDPRRGANAIAEPANGAFCRVWLKSLVTSTGGGGIDGDQICARVAFLSSLLQGGRYRLAGRISRAPSSDSAQLWLIWRGPRGRKRRLDDPL